MAIDRTVRSLSALSNASSSRVLNLAAIAMAEADNPKHRAAPFFDSPVINGAIILKHRLRADEVDAFSPRRAIATKVIIPFEKTDLRAGGRSFFIGQRFFEEMLREVGNYGEKLDMKRDLDVMRLVDSVPSLDPFLLREHLRGNEITPDACYFSISSADQQRMFEYAAKEVRRLTALAVNGKNTTRDSSTSKIVTALLSSEVNDKLEPLRVTLKLAADEFTEGIFSWRGFLYYKWSLEEFWPNIIRVLRDIKAIRPVGQIDSDQAAYLTNIKRALIMGVKSNSDDVRRVLTIYDDAYSQTHRQAGSQTLPGIPAQRAVDVPGAGRKDRLDVAHHQLLAVSLSRQGAETGGRRGAHDDLPGFRAQFRTGVRRAIPGARSRPPELFASRTIARRQPAQLQVFFFGVALFLRRFCEAMPSDGFWAIHSSASARCLNGPT